MKKIFMMMSKRLCLLAMVGTMGMATLAAQNPANAAAMEKEMAQVRQDMEEGKITQGQAMQKQMEIQQRYLSGKSSTPPQQQSLQGPYAGWPAAQAFRSFQFPVINQPSGTTASFNYTPVSALVIFIRGGNAAAVTQDLVRQVNAGTKSEMTTDNGAYTLQIVNTGAVKGNLRTVIEQKGDVVVFDLSVYH
jgi:hypothetical protein